MPVIKEVKILIKNLFTLEGYSAKQLESFPAKVEHRQHLQVVAKATSYSVGRSVISAMADDRCSACTADNIDLVYELMLHKNCTLCLITPPYYLHKIIKIG